MNNNNRFTKSLMSLPMIRRDNFSFIDSLSLCRDSTPSCCMSCLGVTTTRTFRRPAFYAALLPRRGPHYASHSVCPSLRLSVRPSRYRYVTERHDARPSELQRHTYFSARAEGRISYGHLGRTDSCLTRLAFNSRYLYYRRYKLNLRKKL